MGACYNSVRELDHLVPVLCTFYSQIVEPKCSIQNWISLCDFDSLIPPDFTSKKRYLLKSSFLHN